MSARQHFAGAEGSVAAARRLVVEETSHLAPEIREAAELMVSELATNAVVHADSSFEVLIDVTGTSLLVEVTDHGVGAPRPQSPGEHDPHGRGLRIVQALSDSWGIDHRESGAGKTVWFTVRLSPGGSGQATPPEGDVVPTRSDVVGARARRPPTRSPGPRRPGTGPSLRRRGRFALSASG
jgi:anti-sigma regulatory factor (Ser/Thr protein kinase)